MLNTYSLTSAQGIELNKETTVGEEGLISFSLYFKPFAKGVTTFEYYDPVRKESDLYDVKLYKPNHKERIKCHLQGEVVDFPEGKMLAIVEVGKDFIANARTFIPVRNGKFDYTLYTDDEQVWQLAFYNEMKQYKFNKPFHITEFFAENGEINFKLYNSENWAKTIIKGGKLNTEYQKASQLTLACQYIGDEIKKLDAAGGKNTPEFTAQCDSLNKVQNNNADTALTRAIMERMVELFTSKQMLTAEGRALDDSLRVLSAQEYAEMNDFVKEQTDLVGYTLLLKKLANDTWVLKNRLDVVDSVALSRVELFHNVYEKKYPEHPYTQLVQKYIKNGGAEFYIR